MRNLTKQKGLSLIELMIAVTLGMVIVLFMTQIYTNVMKSNSEVAKTNNQIENARFAIQYLRQDLLHTGYWGPHTPTYDDVTFADAPADVPTFVPNPCLAYNLWPDAETPGHVRAMVGVAVQVHSGIPGTCGGIITNKAANTDVLVVRHAERCIPGAGNCDADDPDRLYFQASNCESELDAGSYYALDPNEFPLFERDCDGSGGGTTAAKRRFMQEIYYVRDYLDEPGDGLPTLMRSSFDVTGGVPAQQAATPLVTGIDRFRVELGIDNLSDSGAAVNLGQAISWADEDTRESPTNRGDGVHDGAFVHCGAGCTSAQLVNVVAVKLYILARAAKETAGHTDSKTYTLGTMDVAAFNDNVKRHAYSTTVRLATVSARRETP